MERVLITGVSGLAGSHLVEELKEDYEIIGVHRSKSKYSNLAKMNLRDEITEELVDIRNFNELRDVISYYEPDKIIHLAAQALTGKGRTDPLNTYKTNVIGTVNILEAVRLSHSDPEVTVMSSDKVFGECEKAEENDQYEPTGPYATSKIAVDAASESFRRSYDMNIQTVRSVNIYGYESYNRRIVSNTIVQCLKDQNPVLFDNIKGKREYIYVEDFTRAIEELMDKEPGKYNLTTGDTFSQSRVVQEVLEFFPDLEPDIKTKNNPEGEVSEISLETNNFEFEQEYSFKEGLKKTIDTYRRLGSKELQSSQQHE